MSSIGPMVCEKIIFKYIDWTSNIDLAERSKVNLDLWNLFIAIVSLGYTYQVRIMTKASTVFNKINFSKFSHLNALGSKFDLDI